MFYFNRETLKFRHQISLEPRYFFIDLQFQPFTHNLLLLTSEQQIRIISDEKKLLAKIKKCYAWGLCCLPNGNLCMTSEFSHKMRIFDSNGRFLSEFGRSESSRLYYPRNICYLDRWNAPSSSASSLLLVVDCQKKVNIWNADHLQHVSNIDLDFRPHKMRVDLNGLIYVCESHRLPDLGSTKKLPSGSNSL